MKIAIVGSGISGLTCAYYLSRDHEVHLFEKENHLGGHTNTIEVEIDNEIIPVDAGFILFNLVNYPNLMNFFDELNVEITKSNMSFSVWNQKLNQYYAGTHINTFFAKRSNFFNSIHYKFLLEIIRFNKLLSKTLQHEDDYISLGEFLDSNFFSEYFQENYILPMSSAIWSIPMSQVKQFPLKALGKFFSNHGLLSFNGHYQWYTVKNGSYQYIKKILQESKFRYYLNEPVIEVVRLIDKNKVYVKTTKSQDFFDIVILATHAPTSRKILKNITPQEESILRNFKYHPNVAILHTDDKIMCPEKRIWSSWNYKIGKNGQTSVTYYMRELQPWIKKNIFVSINEFEKLDKSKIIKYIEYEHPIIDAKYMIALKDLDTLNNNHLVYFCGAYFNYGFHEDGLNSALKVINKINLRLYYETFKAQ